MSDPPRPSYEQLKALLADLQALLLLPNIGSAVRDAVDGSISRVRQSMFRPNMTTDSYYELLQWSSQIRSDSSHRLQAMNEQRFPREPRRRDEVKSRPAPEPVTSGPVSMPIRPEGHPDLFIPLPDSTSSSRTVAPSNPAVPNPQAGAQIVEPSGSQSQSHNRNASTSTFGTPKDRSKEYFSMSGSAQYAHKHQDSVASTSSQSTNSSEFSSSQSSSSHETTDERSNYQPTQGSGRNTAAQHQGTMPSSASSHIAPGEVRRAASSGAPQSGQGGTQHTTSQRQTFPPNNPPGQIKRSTSSGAPQSGQGGTQHTTSQRQTFPPNNPPGQVKRSTSSGAPQSVQGFSEHTTSHHANSGNLSHNARTNLQPPTGRDQAMPRSHPSHTTAPPSSFHQAQVHQAQVHGAPQAGYSSGPAPQTYAQYGTGQHQAMSGSHMNVHSSSYTSPGNAYAQRPSGVPMTPQSSQGSGQFAPQAQQQYSQQASSSAMPTGSASSNSNTQGPVVWSASRGGWYNSAGVRFHLDGAGGFTPDTKGKSRDRGQ